MRTLFRRGAGGTEPPTASAEAPAERPQWRRPSSSMYSPLAAIVRPETLTVSLDATVREALQAMDRVRGGFVVVVDQRTHYPLGIFTLEDLLRRVTLVGGDLEQPIACVMTSGLITLTPQATAHRAALVMARNGVRHVVVVDGAGKLVGVVSQDDLFSLQRMGVMEISADIGAATDVERLRQAGASIRGLTDGLLAQGIGPETITQFISTLNDLLTIRLIELTADQFDLPPVPMCWIALGSEGRLEQTFYTDQDNGLIFEAERHDVEEVRAALLPFAQQVNASLDRCGFPLCVGKIMAGNPHWCLTLPEWQRRFSAWIETPRPEAVLHSAIFFDFRAVYGDERLAVQLRDWLVGAAAGQPRFLRLMAEAALQCQPPLGRVRDFIYHERKRFPHTIDLKIYGSRPFVDAARILGLARQVRHTSTAERLRGVSDAIHFGTDGLAALVDGFYYIHLLRLRHQCRAGAAAQPHNRIDPRDLNDLDRRLLKEAFRQARKLQQQLALDYRLH